MKPRRPVKAVSIEERKRGIVERCGALDERLGQRSTLEEAERGRDMELDIHKASGPRPQASAFC
jgi:hypothetical protein